MTHKLSFSSVFTHILVKIYNQQKKTKEFKIQLYKKKINYLFSLIYLILFEIKLTYNKNARHLILQHKNKHIILARC